MGTNSDLLDRCPGFYCVLDLHGIRREGVMSEGFSAVMFWIFSALCGLNVQSGNYGLAAFMALLAISSALQARNGGR
jgi:hypothetical protein